MDDQSELRSAILELVVSFYQGSHDFNGIPVDTLEETISRNRAAIYDTLVDLIHAGEISAVFPDRHPNPHIRALDDEPIATQIDKLRTGRHDFCLYPTATTLTPRADEKVYEGRPFSLRLARGEPQLAFSAFDVAVLEFYRNDPRYYYFTDDISGTISVRDQHYLSDAMRESDKVLFRFGFAYDDKFNRAVAGFLRDLGELTAEHQQVWAARLLGPGFKLHPDYFRAAFLGEFYERISIFDAFLEEIKALNGMAAAMGHPGLFSNDFAERPKGFSFLIRPTVKELESFVHLLDKMLSENLNRDFFRGQIPLEAETTREDGKVVVEQKGTIRLLEEWIAAKVKVRDSEPLKEMFRTFRKIRKERQRPAHVVSDDQFDMEIFKQQRAWIIEAYEAMRLLRLLFSNHPRAKTVEISEELREGKIWTY